MRIAYVAPVDTALHYSIGISGYASGIGTVIEKFFFAFFVGESVLFQNYFGINYG